MKDLEGYANKNEEEKTRRCPRMLTYSQQNGNFPKYYVGSENWHIFRGTFLRLR